ncbi:MULTISPECIES: DUF6054 family protein [Bacillaceae]|uniref:DUF6054 family protein n=1 Tax=Bacillaceae TaxID=186817 RepID=UPI000BEE1188|nr:MULTISPECIES: DUF6054 family protein [unclassified Bacillus (in: firmicutes)]PEC48399.1 hypothetical protein CON00_15930 [Bacillus sp. AFS096315]PFM81177.1 hypothetical protein COJ46_09670 [Bacillus sp. AFS077874]
MKHYLEFTVNIKPVQVSQILLEDTELKSNLIFQDYKVAEEKEIAILVFQKYFFRNDSTATLTVTIDNFSGETYVKCISSGNGEGIFDIGWGAGKSFIKPIRLKLAANLLEVIEDN